MNVQCQIENLTDRSTNRHGIVLRRRRIGAGSAAHEPAFFRINGLHPSDKNSLAQESDGDEDSGSISDNPDMLPFEGLSYKLAPEAPMGVSNPGNFQDYPEFNHEAIPKSVEPFEMSLQRVQSTPSSTLPASGVSLQDTFLDQNSANMVSAFPADYQWNDNALALNTDALTSGPIQIQDQTIKTDNENCTVLTLYNVESETLNRMLETAFRSKTKVKMETYH
ncbi:hypothetical protein ACLMJK_003648 [Lecanora helva]